jgi:hypothetical protein
LRKILPDKDNTREIDEFLSKELPRDEGDVVVGWVIAYEIVDSDGKKSAGFVYEYNDMTPWRATGLLDWARNVILRGAGRQ